MPDEVVDRLDPAAVYTSSSSPRAYAQIYHFSTTKYQTSNDDDQRQNSSANLESVIGFGRWI
jgi:hypothetical protein